MRPILSPERREDALLVAGLISFWVLAFLAGLLIANLLPERLL